MTRTIVGCWLRRNTPHCSNLEWIRHFLPDRLKACLNKWRWSTTGKKLMSLWVSPTVDMKLVAAIEVMTVMGESSNGRF
jgi:hypothetical protein